ncbi:MAG: DUF1343 domain-containing protein [Gammaproteobacteria bacterium]|nr:DUF1343 domain-containing protein [Gammaproteobacteria bacterium]
MQLGVERLISNKILRKSLHGAKIALTGHPASLTSHMVHSLDALAGCSDLTISAAFGPQHGMRGDKQDNMIESDNFVDHKHNIPVFSLYGEVRRPTDEMMATFDVLLFDVQDLGCRIYTYITTLLYLLEACAAKGKRFLVLDRPNPAGRPIEGNILEDGWQSFVGAGCIAMRHGLTVGEMAKWFVKHHNIDVDLQVIAMDAYDPNAAPGYGWPVGELAWVNPSPNASSLNMARCYSGTVILEGTELSEGRGTTIPLEIMGAPDIDIHQALHKMSELAPQWLHGAFVRPLYFEPVFHKHAGKLCQGFQMHTDTMHFNPNTFKPFRLTLLFLKAIRLLYPNYKLWRQFAYEYETGRLPFDVINGGPKIREWVDNPGASIHDLDKFLKHHEQEWFDSVQEFLIY